MSDYKHLCSKLRLHRLIKANQLAANDKLIKFVESSDTDGRVPRFHNETSTKSFVNTFNMNQTNIYQIQFETIPGHGLFELTAEYNPLNGTFFIQKKRLSRLNKYGNNSACIADLRPDLREICYCSNLLKQTMIPSSSSSR